jgi:rod shape-determining protein MreD
MRYLVGGTIAFMLAILQVSSVQQFVVLGVSPNLVLVMLVAWLVVRGLEDVLPMVAVAGLTLGLVDLQTPGLVMLALVLSIAAMGAIRELHVVHSDFVLTLLLVAGASLIYESIMFAYVLATGGVFDPVAGLLEAVLPAALVNLMIAPPVYLLMRLARPAAQRNAYSW